MARLTADALALLTAKPGYRVESQLGHAAAYPAVAPQIPDAQPELSARPEPLAAHSGEEARGPRIAVCITRLGEKLLDKDNLYGGVKYLCDALRYEGLIPQDDPESIHLIVQQRKVKRAEVGTLIEITPIQ